MELMRFIDAQQEIYPQVVQELKEGQKKSHWMWFIFPQIKGLGSSSTAKFYAIQGLTEAKAYLKDEILGPRLHECCRLVLQHPERSVESMFGYPDNLKLKSSMTLFGEASREPVFQQVLDQFFNGERDQRTIAILQGG